MNRPEEGTTLRAKLCKLLTSPLIELRDLVAELLFILCKENGNSSIYLNMSKSYKNDIHIYLLLEYFNVHKAV